MNSNSSLNGKSNNKLSMFRNQIDEIDRELMDILIRRVSLSKEIAAYKLENDLPIRDRDRELILIDDRTKKIDDPVVREALADVLEAVLKASRDIQQDMHNDQNDK